MMLFWLVLLGFGTVSTRAQTVSFVITNLQSSLPITAFTGISVITNYPPGDPPIFINTITAPLISGSYHFTHWTLNDLRANDDTGRAANPATITFTNNVDAVAHYVPTADYTGDSIVPDWIKIEYYGDTANDAFSDTDGDGFNLQTEIARGYHPRLFDSLVEGGISRRRSESLIVLSNTNLVRVTASSDPVGLYSDFKILSKGQTVSVPAEPSGGGFIGWYSEGKRIDNLRGFSSGTLTFRLVDVNEATLYANQTGYLSNHAFPGNGIEFGDEVVLAGVNRVVTEFSFPTYFNGPTNGFETIELFLRANDGANGEPGSILYRSGERPLNAGAQKTTLNQLHVTVPNSFTWSVVMNGLDSQAEAGLLVADPPTAGSSSASYWKRGNDGSWQTAQIDNGAVPANFMATIFSSDGIIVTGNDLLIEVRFYRGETDSDGDGIDDSYEWYYFNTLNNNPDSDPDQDGLSIGIEKQRGYQPNAPDQLIEGGISRRRSLTTLVISDINLARVTAQSDPVGLYSDFKLVTKGNAYSLPAQPTGTGFYGWFVDSVRVDDPMGFSTGTLNFIINEDTVFEARYVQGAADSDADGIDDSYELYHFNSLAYNLDSDPDGDGFDIRSELSRGYHPQAVDTITEGGISRRRSLTSLFVPPPPEIVVEPVGADVVEGASKVLSVEARGIGLLQYQWRLNGVNLIGETNATITIDSVTVDNSGSYSVAAVTPFGSVNSDPAIVMVAADPLPFTNVFADSQLFTELCGKGRAVNLVSNREFGEPVHHGKAGTNSMWLSWQAPANGVVTFDTRGSSFDTIIAVYTGSDVANLKPVASDDDGEKFFTSTISFDALADEIYRIAVDGIRGAKGHIFLNWCMETTTDDFPRITAQPTGRTVARGASVPFHVQVVSENPASYQWYFNGAPVVGGNSATLRIDNVDVADVGGYRAAVWIGTQTNWSDTAVLQVGNKENASVKKKTGDLFELPESGGIALQSVLRDWKRAVSGGSGFAPISVSVSQGDPGSQVFSSFGATTEPGEFNHGDKIWYSTDNLILRPASAGRLFVETRGDRAGIALAAYALVNNDFREAVEAGFDDDEDGRTLLNFDADAGSDYLVIWAAKNTNVVRFETVWGLGDNPSVIAQEQNLVIQAGSPLTLRAWSGGVGTIGYQWQRNGSPIAGATSAEYNVPSVQSGNAGVYDVVVTATGGSTTKRIATVTVAGTARLQGAVRYFGSSQPVPGITIDPGDSAVGSVQSGGDGSFEFQLGVGRDYALQLIKSEAPSAGRTVTGADITLMRRHILKISDFTSFHSLLAADVNEDFKISTLDIILLRRYILNGISPGAAWRFVPEDQPFAFSRFPSPYERIRKVRGLSSDRLGLNYVALRGGDVNATWATAGTQGFNPENADFERLRLLGGGAWRRPPVRLAVSNDDSSEGTQAEVRVQGADFSEVTSLQFTLEWDPRLWRYRGITSRALADVGPENFGMGQVDQGRILFLWDDPKGRGVRLGDGEVLFGVELEPVRKGTLRPVVRLSDAPAVREATIEGRITELITEPANPSLDIRTLGSASVALDAANPDRIGVAVETLRGRVYVLEAKEDITQSEWMEVDRLVGDGTRRILKDDARTHPHRFYRIREE
ncbi:MAG: hypothetical protein K9N62_12555 [Verrucomicrobia bacterium]|nr:hypothetical protein [Verrucomicrobiota bacterium]